MASSFHKWTPEEFDARVHEAMDLAVKLFPNDKKNGGRVLSLSFTISDKYWNLCKSLDAPALQKVMDEMIKMGADLDNWPIEKIVFKDPLP